MKYYFDDFGILSATAIPDRFTTISPPNIELRQGFVWRWEGYSWEQFDPLPPVQPVQPKPLEPKRITRLAFLNRFTDAEAIAIDLASIGTTVQAAAMRRYMSKVNAAEFIDLDSKETRDGVLALEAATLLEVGRALIILDSPILETEKFIK